MQFLKTPRQNKEVIGMEKKVFEREEKKYLITQSQYTSLMRAVQGWMQADAYGISTVCSLYFDTPDYHFIRSSIEKTNYKEKLRLRSYGRVGPEDTVFLELKKKFDGVVYKRRAVMSLREAGVFLQGGHTDNTGPVLQEIRWLLGNYDLKPAVFIAYDRTALCGAETPGLRVTFDADLRWRGADFYLSHETYGAPLLEQGRMVMEIKALGAIPVWLSRVLSEQKIFPCSFSKYGTCYKNCLCPQAKQRGVFRCA